MKKILLMSDSHWNDSILEPIIQKYKNEIDMVVHCGDVQMSPAELKEISPVPVYIVKGNNDFSTTAEMQYLVEIQGHKCLIVHGHRQYIKESMDYMANYAKRKEADVVFYGHTHIHKVETIDGILLINPGSLETNEYGTYMIVEFLDDGSIKPHLHRVRDEFSEEERGSHSTEDPFRFRKDIEIFFRNLFRKGN